ncbi:class I SAM-dependent methyltransferase [Sporomusa silvacetica]|uniref:class I SAM-dependent methyltransferase n=1 Tax=Sporomusa silvacetica TaxID=55504 RepID=UPI001FE60F34|nr:class I SAM-dependent methyltransferase [Sporomusa silvacetica]
MQDKTKLTIDAYNKNFAGYADKFMKYSPYAQHVIEFAGLLEDDFKVLDIGCGPGNVAKQLCAVRRLEITGIDLSSEMLEIAKVSVPDGIFQLQDFRKARFLSEYFDAVVLSFSIVHLDDDEVNEVLANAVKWLRSDGYLYVSFMEGKQAGFETTSFSLQPLYFNYFQEAKIEAFFKANGIDCFRSIRQDYLEPDGSNTTDVFLFGKKQQG